MAGNVAASFAYVIRKYSPPMKRKIYCLTLAFLIYSVGVWAQEPSGNNWHLEKEGNGIQVFTTAGSSGIKRIKVSAVLNGTLNQVSAIFRDIARQKDWVYSTRRAYLIQKTDDEHLLYYNQTALPWPVSDRDIAIRMKLNEDITHHTLTITQTGEPTAVAVQKGLVRVPHLSGLWQFRESGGQLHADYYLDIDPGGSRPAWVVNMFAAKGPYETFVNLQKLLHG